MINQFNRFLVLPHDIDNVFLVNFIKLVGKENYKLEGRKLYFYINSENYPLINFIAEYGFLEKLEFYI